MVIICNKVQNEGLCSEPKGVLHVEVLGLYFMSFIIVILSLRSLCVYFPFLVMFKKIEITKKVILGYEGYYINYFYCFKH